MLTCGELALFLKASAARVERELTPTTKRFLDGVATDARGLIGQERAEWPPLAASTIADKNRRGFGGQVSATDPLLRTGGLRSSITAQAQADGRGAEGAVGSDSKIAAYQEMGTSKIPPRPFLSAALGQSQPKAERIFGHLGQELLSPGIR